MDDKVFVESQRVSRDIGRRRKVLIIAGVLVAIVALIAGYAIYTYMQQRDSVRELDTAERTVRFGANSLELPEGITKSDAYDAYLGNANSTIARMDYEAGMTILDQVATLYPNETKNDAYFNYLRADALVGLNRKDEARAEYDAALAGLGQGWSSDEFASEEEFRKVLEFKKSELE